MAGIDVSLPRRESKTGRGHAASRSRAIRSCRSQEAARRRDFTVNAIAWDPLTGEYVDPFDGRGDLERGVLRAVDPRDVRRRQPARAARGPVRGAVRVRRSTPATKAICAGSIPLDDLPAERIWGEIEKLLLRARTAVDRAARSRSSSASSSGCFPSSTRSSAARRSPSGIPEGDVWVHTLLVIDEARRRIDDLEHPQQVAVMLGAVCHDLGKPATTAFIDGRIRSMDHEEEGVAAGHARCSIG